MVDGNSIYRNHHFSKLIHLTILLNLIQIITALSQMKSL